MMKSWNILSVLAFPPSLHGLNAHQIIWWVDLNKAEDSSRFGHFGSYSSGAGTGSWAFMAIEQPEGAIAIPTVLSVPFYRLTLNLVSSSLKKCLRKSWKMKLLWGESSHANSHDSPYSLVLLSQHGKKKCWIHPDKKIRFDKIKKCSLSGNRCGVLMLHCQWHCSLQFSLLHWLGIYIVPYPWQLLPKMIYNMIVTGLPVTYKYDAIVFVVCRLKSCLPGLLDKGTMLGYNVRLHHGVDPALCCTSGNPLTTCLLLCLPLWRKCP